MKLVPCVLLLQIVFWSWYFSRKKMCSKKLSSGLSNCHYQPVTYLRHPIFKHNQDKIAVVSLLWVRFPWSAFNSFFRSSNNPSRTEFKLILQTISCFYMSSAINLHINLGFSVSASFILSWQFSVQVFFGL